MLKKKNFIHPNCIQKKKLLLHAVLTQFTSYFFHHTLKKIDNYENIHSENHLYLIVHSATGYFTEENDNRYLILYSTNKYEEVWSGIRAEIKRINGRKELFDEKDYSRIRVDTDDDLPLNKTIKLSTLTIIVRAVFQEGKKLYP